MASITKMLISMAVVLASTALGVYLAHNSIAIGARMESSVFSGNWSTNTVIGSVHADPRTRAYIAKMGLLALSPEETTYYHLYDYNGEAISSDYVYEIRGDKIPARWWSITAYGDDSFLIENTQKKYSVQSSQIIREPDGSFVIRISREPYAGNWISLGHAKKVSLLLRLYDPPPEIRQKLDGLELPVIHKIGEAS